MNDENSKIIYAPYILSETAETLINGMRADEWNELEMHSILNGTESDDLNLSKQLDKFRKVKINTRYATY